MAKNYHNNPEAARLFRRVVNGANIMTPNIICYQKAGNYVVEIARGTDMEDREIFGVSVVDAIAREHRHDLSQIFGNRTMARKYIEKLATL